MEYERTIPFRGDAEKAIKSVCDTLSANNFRLEQVDTSRVRFLGPGFNGSKDNPLRGISSGEISVTAGSIVFRGDMRGIRNFKLFLTCFLGGMAAFFFILFGVILHRQMPPRTIYLSLIPFAPWVILVPFIGRLMKRKTQFAIENLLHNAATLGEK